MIEKTQIKIREWLKGVLLFIYPTTLVAAFAIFPWFFAYASDSNASKPPLILPFVLDKAESKAATELVIAEHNIYYFGLRFSYKRDDQTDRERVKKIMGGFALDKKGKVIEPGIPTPIRLVVYRTESSVEKLIFEKKIDPILTSWGSGNFEKNIGYTELAPGRYRIQIESLRNIPELAGTPVAMTIGYDRYKSTFTPKK